MNRKAIGDRAEQHACDYLQRCGLKLLRRNFHCRGGEIDLIMQHHDTLVFIEVRYRRRTAWGRATESISPEKQSRLIRCAQHYINRYRQWNTAARFDVVCIEGEPGETQLEWITNAFAADAPNR